LKGFYFLKNKSLHKHSRWRFLEIEKPPPFRKVWIHNIPETFSKGFQLYGFSCLSVETNKSPHFYMMPGREFPLKTLLKIKA
jgi:hypothetical protein